MAVSRKIQCDSFGAFRGSVVVSAAFSWQILVVHYLYTVELPGCRDRRCDRSARLPGSGVHSASDRCGCIIQRRTLVAYWRKLGQQLVSTRRLGTGTTLRPH